jgi:hypothetical protein
VRVSPNDNDQGSEHSSSSRSADAGGPETGLVPGGLDMGDFLGSMAAVLTRAAMQPAAFTAASVRFGANLAQIGPAAFSRVLGHPARSPVPADPKDRRFADPAWEKNPAFFALPGPKARYEVMTEDHPPAPAEWREAAKATEGSWWEDWAEWSSSRAGPLGSPPPVGGDRHPPLADAPGTYVRE